MSISIKGQSAVDNAIKAMKDRSELELFGNRYIVYDVQVLHQSVTDSINGTVNLMCVTKHRELSEIPHNSRAERDAAITKAMEDGRKAAEECFSGVNP